MSISVLGPRTYFMGHWYRCGTDILSYTALHQIPDLALLLIGATVG